MKKQWLWLSFLLIPFLLFIYSFIIAVAGKSVKVFFDVPLYAILNIVIAILFAYYLSQRNTDRRKKITLLENVIDKLIHVLDIECLCNICDESDIEHIRIAQRSAQNKIALLKDFEKDFKIEKEVTYIKQKFDSYWEIVSNHLNDVNHLKNSKKELVSSITAVIDKLEYLVIRINI